MKTYTQQWNELKSEVMAVFESMGDTMVLVNNDTRINVNYKTSDGTRIAPVRCISAKGVSFFDAKEKSRFMKLSDIRDFQMMELADLLTKKKESRKDSFRSRLRAINRTTWDIYEEAVRKDKELYFENSLTLRFEMTKNLKLFRVGSWGVMLKDSKNQCYEADFSYLDTSSRCKLAELLAS